MQRPIAVCLLVLIAGCATAMAADEWGDLTMRLVYE